MNIAVTDILIGLLTSVVAGICRRNIPPAASCSSNAFRGLSIDLAPRINATVGVQDGEFQNNVAGLSSTCAGQGRPVGPNSF